MLDQLLSNKPSSGQKEGFLAPLSTPSWICYLLNYFKHFFTLIAWVVLIVLKPSSSSLYTSN